MIQLRIILGGSNTLLRLANEREKKSIQRHSCDCRIVENETDERSGAKDLNPQQRDIHDV